MDPSRVLFYWATHSTLNLTNLMDPYVTVHIDVRINLLLYLSSFSICIFISLLPAYVYLNMYTHNPAHMSIFIYWSTYTHLPPSSRTLLLVSKYTYMSLCIPLPLLCELVFSLCFLLRVCLCMYMCTYICTCILMNPLYPVCVCALYVLFRSYRAVYVFGALRLVCSVAYS